jgi:uncharacterized ubiquitin-like protein YukD
MIFRNPDISLTRTVESAKNMIREVVETMNISSYWKYKLKVSTPQIPLLNELRHIVGMEGFDVNNSIDFIQKDIVLQEDEILMSFDIVY